MSVFELFISAIFVNNIVLASTSQLPVPRLLPRQGGRRRHGQRGDLRHLYGDAVHVAHAAVCAGSFELGYLQTIVFILVIAGLVQFVEMFLKKVLPPLYSALGIFLPLITTNCAVMGVTILVQREEYDLTTSLLYAVASSLGFMLAAHPHGGHPRTAGHLPCAQGTHGNPHRADHGGADVAGLHGLQGYDLIEKESRYGYDIGTGAPRARAGDGDGARRGVPRLPC